MEVVEKIAVAVVKNRAQVAALAVVLTDAMIFV